MKIIKPKPTAQLLNDKCKGNVLKVYIWKRTTDLTDLINNASFCPFLLPGQPWPIKGWPWVDPLEGVSGASVGHPWSPTVPRGWTHQYNIYIDGRNQSFQVQHCLKCRAALASHRASGCQITDAVALLFDQTTQVHIGSVSVATRHEVRLFNGTLLILEHTTRAAALMKPTPPATWKMKKRKEMRTLGVGTIDIANRYDITVVV